MRGNVFLKGMGLGVAVGVAAAAAIIPVDKKKMMKSGAGKAIKAIGEAVETIL